jgi:hypothetical protein
VHFSIASWNKPQRLAYFNNAKNTEIQTREQNHTDGENQIHSKLMASNFNYITVYALKKISYFKIAKFENL